MCHGHPHYHTCQHTSVKWLYCPEAVFDLDTGYETPCSNPIYSTPQPSNADCPLQNCHFKTLRGSWTCCKCGTDTNTQGWCSGMTNRLGNAWAPRGLEPSAWQTCGHGCCSKCTRNTSSRGSTPEMSIEIRKGKSSRKSRFTSRSSHKHVEFGGTLSMVHEEEEQSATSSNSGSSSGSSGSKSSGFDVSLEYPAKKSKPSSGKKKGSRRHHH